MVLRALCIVVVCFVQSEALAKECWALTEVQGQMAASNEYKFEKDGYSNPMILCFDGDKGSVSGDDTALTRFGESTLAGWGANKNIELFEVYQIDRARNKVLFTKARIGTNSVIPGAPDVVGAFVGKAIKLTE